MKRRSFVQGTSIRKQVLRQRRIYTSFSNMWETLHTKADEIVSREAAKQQSKQSRPEAA